MDWHDRFEQALVLHRRGELAGAIAEYREVLQLQPGQFDGWRLLGAALLSAGQPQASLDAFDRALTIRADLAEVWALRGDALSQMAQPEPAVASYERALAMQPGRAATWNSLGLQRRALGRAVEACASHQRAVVLAPDDARFAFNLGLAQLTLGKFESGWEGFEKRQALPALATPFPVPGPVWTGRENLRNRDVLVLCEQGIGDAIQFCRFLPALVAQGARVSVNRPPALRGLIESVEAAVHWIDDGQAVPHFDLQCGLLSLAHRLNIGAESIPARVPYLAPPARQLQQWRARLGPHGRRRVGIVCSGNLHHANDRRRSIPLRAFAALQDLGLELHLLQNELREADVAWLEALSIIDHRPHLRDFADTAALASCMDAIVSVDTAVAHLAGALNLPVSVLLPLGPDWRWMIERSDSPWYPSARLYRQTDYDNWQSVLEQVAKDLIQPGTAAVAAAGVSA